MLKRTVFWAPITYLKTENIHKFTLRSFVWYLWETPLLSCVSESHELGDKKKGQRLAAPSNISDFSAMWVDKPCSAAVNLKIENTRWVSFDITFTGQGFENACWHREACRAIQHAFSKPSLVNLISKDANLVFYLSVYPLLNTRQTSDYDVIFDFVLIQRH